MAGVEVLAVSPAPPARIVIKGWFSQRELTYAEAEAWNLREASKLCGSPFVSVQAKQRECLVQADRNRWAGRSDSAVPPALARL